MKLKSFIQNERNEFGTKMIYFSIWAGMVKIYCRICNQHLPIYLIAKFRAKIGILKLRSKNALFGFLGSHYHIYNLGVEVLKFGAKNNISLNLEPKLWSYLKSAPSNL